MAGRSRYRGLVLAVAVLAGCSSLPPGSAFQKTRSSALVQHEQTHLGQLFGNTGRGHGEKSGFRIIPLGEDGFLARMEMINAAERTLDLQYYIFHGDDTGRLLTGAVLHAADRGVRVRILVDDGETLAGDEQLTALEAHPLIELRIFNPFAYRGHVEGIRAIEFAFNSGRLDYRMHNKLLVVDNSAALIGGRNIGDQYFQIDPESQFADDDVFCVGPVVQRLSGTFDDFWNSDMAIPAQALGSGKSSRAALDEHREDLKEERREAKADGTDYVTRIALAEPFAGLVSGRLPLVWAAASVVCDSPDKKKVESGAMSGRLMQPAVAQVTQAVRSELLVITPYLIPGADGMELLAGLRRRDVKVRVLTNSLESSTVLIAQAGYMHYRIPLLEQGVELYEIRALLGNAMGSGQTAVMSRNGTYSLHAKMFVFDRERIFIGSMNLDQRSHHLNTEIGLIIDSPELAQQVAKRFDAMVQLINAYTLELRQPGGGAAPTLAWRKLQSTRVAP